MEAAGWAAIGLLGTISFSFLFYLGSRIDAQGRELRTAIAGQGGELGGRIDRLSARIDAQSAELGARIDAQGVQLGGRIDALTGALNDHLQRRHAG